jgi:Family of unknown function (DUF5947)
MSSGSSSVFSSLVRLRQFAQNRRTVELCGFCAVELPHNHEHLLETATRKMECVCRGCAILFTNQGQKYQRVPRRIRALEDFRITDAQWKALAIPIGMAFLFYSSRDKKVVALYPSPGGPIESQLPLKSWEEIANNNPQLREMKPDVEGLLIHRIGSARDYYLIPIDECFKLVGIIRSHWKGISGGFTVWEQVGNFLSALKQNAQSEFHN